MKKGFLKNTAAKPAAKKKALSAAKTKEAAIVGKTKAVPAAAGKKKTSELLREKREKAHPGKNFRKADVKKAGKKKTAAAIIDEKLAVIEARGTVAPEDLSGVDMTPDDEVFSVPFAEDMGVSDYTAADPKVVAAPAGVTKSAGGQQRLDGFSFAQICRWMGRENFTEKQAIAALEGAGLAVVSKPGVRGSLGAGRLTSPRYDASAIPALPDALAARLRAYLPSKGI